MNRKLIVVFVVAAGILLYLFAGRKTMSAGNVPVAQPGAAAGGVNFSSVDVVSGLPVFDSTANPAYIKGVAPQSGGTYNCPSGTTPAVNASNGAVYCVVPAEAGVFNAQVPTTAPANYTPTIQGPTQSGGYLGQPTIQVVPYTPPVDQGTLVGTAAPAQSVDPVFDQSSFFDTAGTDSSSVFFS